jgi:sortase B
LESRSEQTEKDATTQAKGKRRSVAALSVVLVVLLVGAALGAGYAGYLIWQKQQLAQIAEEARETQVPAAPELDNDKRDEPDSRVANPIDFAALKLENPDIYAWISVPNTNVNYPILQHLNDDNYYLTHNRANQKSIEGAIYSQQMNSTSFNDPVTLIYGHSVLEEGAMFSTLHYFENPDFFTANDIFYIYTPGHILTYQIVSAYIYDDRHILNSFDFSDVSTLQKYFDFVQNPDSLLVNRRAGVQLTSDDKIVQLSTCLSDLFQVSSRFLVSGVQIDDQPSY